jgi:Luciferase-like monooxygenase
VAELLAPTERAEPLQSQPAEPLADAKIKGMQIGIAAHVAGPEDAQFLRDAERLGVSAVWVAEAWGQDAFTPLAYVAARTERSRWAPRSLSLARALRPTWP